jgi:transposase
MCPVPKATIRGACAADPKGKLSLHMRDVLGRISIAQEGQPAQAPWRLALGTVMHCGENLSERQAATAVRGRIDEKELVGLERADPGCDASVLSECRARLREKHAKDLVREKRPALVQQERLAPGSRTPAHRFDPCAGEDRRPQPGACSPSPSVGGTLWPSP